MSPSAGGKQRAERDKCTADRAINAQRMEVQPSEAPTPGKISKEVAERYQVRVIHVKL